MNVDCHHTSNKPGAASTQSCTVQCFLFGSERKVLEPNLLLRENSESDFLLLADYRSTVNL